MRLSDAVRGHKIVFGHEYQEDMVKQRRPNKTKNIIENRIDKLCTPVIRVKRNRSIILLMTGRIRCRGTSVSGGPSTNTVRPDYVATSSTASRIYWVSIHKYSFKRVLRV